MVKKNLVETEAYVSLGQAKQIYVTVAGEVNLPGLQTVSAFSSVLDVLTSAGGVKKTGTLRNIKVMDGDKLRNIDIYDYVFGQNVKKKKDISLRNGSIIVVPPIGKTIALSGIMAKKGIYEINKKSTINNILGFSGGYSIPGDFDLVLKRINPNKGEEFTSNINLSDTPKNGDIVIAIPIKRKLGKGIQTIGSIKYPGIFPNDKYKVISDIIPSKDYLLDETYPFSIIIKSGSNNFSSKNYRVENLWNILNDNKGKTDVKLADSDKVFFLSWKDLEFFQSPKFVSAINPKNKIIFECNTLNKLSTRIKKGGENIRNRYFSLLKHLSNDLREIEETKEIIENRGATSIIRSTERDLDKVTERQDLIYGVKYDCDNVPNIFVEDFELLIKVMDNLVVLKGDIDKPGIYVSDEKSINSLVKFVTKNNSINGKNILISSDRKFIEIFTNYVKIRGAVKFPAEFPYNEGETLLDIIPSSDFLLENTYPLFAIIERKQKETGIQKIISFNPSLILYEKNDLKIKKNDKITFFTLNQMENLASSILENENKLNLANNNMESFDDNQSSFEDKTNNIIGNQSVSNLVDFDNNSLVNNQINKNLILDKLEIKPEKINENRFSEVIEKSINENDIKQDINYCGKSYVKILDKSSISCGKFYNIVRNSIVKISGNVKSPGLYIVGGKTPIEQIISFAGGFSVDANKLKVEISNTKKYSKFENHVFPGSTVFVPPLNFDKTEVKLIGELENPRKIRFKNDLMLSEILGSIKQLTKNVYIYFGTIERKNKDNIEKKLIAFSPIKIIKGEQNIKIESGDIIRFYSENETLFLIRQWSENGSDLTPAITFNDNNVPVSAGTIQELVKRLTYRVEGAVSKPSQLLIASSMSLDSIIDVAGGYTLAANTSRIEIVKPNRDSDNNFILETEILNKAETDFSKININPGTLIRIPRVKNDLELGFINVSGAVSQPGNYRILKGDTLFKIIKRTGGLQPEAYLEGIVFSRNEEKRREKKSINRLTKELEKTILAAVEQQGAKGGIDIGNITALRSLALSAHGFEPIGRVVGDFTKASILKNTIIVNGDKLFIPKKQTSITIVGEVMTPGSIIWDKNKQTNDYINSAAGFTELADTKKVFIISPNGNASKRAGLWSSKKELLPGSTIVIPRKIKLSSNLENVSAITSVVYQLTLTLAGIESLLTD